MRLAAKWWGVDCPYHQESRVTDKDRSTDSFSVTMEVLCSSSAWTTGESVITSSRRRWEEANKRIIISIFLYWLIVQKLNSLSSRKYKIDKRKWVWVVQSETFPRIFPFVWAIKHFAADSFQSWGRRMQQKEYQLRVGQSWICCEGNRRLQCSFKCDEIQRG